jgi:integrase/recombinase XerD
MKRTDDIHRFLQGLSIDVRSRYTYATCLRAYRALCAGRAPSLRTVRVWLARDAARSPLPNVVARLAVIDRYLDWRGGRSGASANPIAKLRTQYGKKLTPIVRALLQEDDHNALDRLRPLPAWGSALGPVMYEYIARMRSLGYRFDAREREMHRFDRFLQGRPELAGKPLRVLSEAWQAYRPGLRHRLTAQRCVRALSQTLHRRDETVAILPIEVGLTRRVVDAQRKPHVYTQREIAKLFAAARLSRARNTPLRPMMLCTMLALTYCAGLRIGELAALTLHDIDLERGIIEIRMTKFFKARRLPIAPKVVALLSRYLKARAATGAPTDPDAPLWWTWQRRKGYAYGQLEKLLADVVRRAGLKPQGGCRGPRVHDLRHAFVAHRMLEWYRAGVEPQSRLPHLATYLGHKDIVSTLVYLNITPELLQQASERYRRRGAEALRTAGGRP